MGVILGEIIILISDEKIVGLVSFYNSEEYIASIHVAYLIISKEYRHKFVFAKLMLFFIKHVSKRNVENILFNAHIENDYLIKLYSKFATQIGEQPNKLGVQSIKFICNVKILIEQYGSLKNN